jgi:thiamine biosynthesis lipoprotein
MLTNYFETKLALGSDTTIVIVTDDQKKPVQLFQKLWHEIFTFERSFSRFLPGSELSQFNRQAGSRQFISPEFRQLLLASQAMAKLTGDLYNPFILPALQRAGYKNSALPGYENDEVDDHSIKRIVPNNRLEIGDDYASIPYGTALDMGGIGKGYLANLLADLLDQEDVAGYWLSLGGDMVMQGFDEHNKPWQTTIQSAYETNKNAPLLVQHNGQRLAVATSGTMRRPKQQSGKKPWHHLIDPRTGQPADTDVIMATVVDDSCLYADVLASCAVIVGSNVAPSYLQKQNVTAVYVQAKYKKVSSYGEVLRPIKQLVTYGAHNE